MEKEVVNITKYYHYETVYVGGKEDDICNNVYKGLDIIRVTNYKLEDLIMPLRPARVKINIRKGQSFSRKRLSSYINALLPPNKYIYLGSPPKGGRGLTTLNRVYQYVIIRDYRKPLYKASSQATILVILKGGIEGYKSSYI